MNPSDPPAACHSAVIASAPMIAWPPILPPVKRNAIEFHTRQPCSSWLKKPRYAAPLPPSGRKAMRQEKENLSLKLNGRLIGSAYQAGVRDSQTVPPISPIPVP